MIQVFAHKLTGVRKRLRLVSTTFGADFLDLGRFPGFNKWDDERDEGNPRHLIIEPTYANLKFLFDVWEEIEWADDGCKIFIDEYEKLKEEHAQVVEAKKTAFADDGSYEYETIPFEHQGKCFQISRDLEKFGIFAEQGTGKTKIIIDTAAWNYEKGVIDTLIVVAPNGVHRAWIEEEIPFHLPKRIPRKMGFHKPTKTKKQQKIYDDVFNAKDCLRIYSFNVESFRSQHSKQLFFDFIKKYRCLVAIDESDTIKNPSTKQTRWLTKICRDVIFKRILTGTPITEGIENLYSQFLFLDKNIIGHTSFTAFKKQYCDMGGWEGTKVVGYKNTEELAKRVEGFTFRILKAECIDLPPKVYQLWPVDMTAEQKKMYKDMMKEWSAEYNGEKLTEDMAVARIIRCQQISSGWWPSKLEDDIKMVPLKNNPKLEALKKVTELNRGKAVIWTRFKADTQIIKQTLGDCSLTYSGADNNDARAEAKHRFQNDPTIKYLIVSVQAGAAGLTLTAADYVIYYTNHHGLRFRLQSEDRTHRIDEERNAGRESIPYIDLCVTGSLDKSILNALRKKKSISDAFLEDPPSMFLEFENEFA